MTKDSGKLICIRGAGDIASGIALRLHRAGMRIVMTDKANPTSIRRTVCFSEAIRCGSKRVEDVTAYRIGDPAQAAAVHLGGGIAVIEDPDMELSQALAPDVIVDAILAKKNLGTRMEDAPCVIGIGPGFTAGLDCHAVVETMRGHTLGRVYYEGSAAKDTGIPGNIGGYTIERILRAPCDGIFRTDHAIGDLVKEGDTVASIEGTEEVLRAQIGGMIRGLLPDGTAVRAGMKSGDIDPRGEQAIYDLVSDKALAVAGGVLEAILRLS